VHKNFSTDSIPKTAMILTENASEVNFEIEAVVAGVFLSGA